MAAGNGRWHGIALALLLLAQVLLVGHQTKSAPSGTRLEHWAARALSPVQHAAAWAARSAESLWSTYVWQVRVARKNETLGAKARQLEIENDRLRGELGAVMARLDTDNYRSSLQFATLAAKVIGQLHPAYPKQLLVNRGTNDGVESGMAVLAPKGIVGRVAVSYENSAMVRLLHDPDSGAGVELAGSGARGVLVGTEGADCQVEYIRSAVPVAPGERIYSSGTDGIYPPGLPIGAVRSVNGGQEMHRITVRLAVDMERLTDVAIVLQDGLTRLPGPVRGALDESLRVPTTGVGRVKRALKEALAEQARQVGETGRKPPDFSAVVASLTDSGGVSEASSLNEE